MKITGIRAKLTFYFLSILFISVVMNAVFVIQHTIIVRRYEQIGTNIFKQNELISATENAISSYNSYRNAPTDLNLDLYTASRQRIYDIFSYLDKSIVKQESRITFAAVQKTIVNVLETLDRGVRDIQDGTFENLSARVAEANKGFTFVKENISDLLIDEIGYGAELQTATSRINTIYLLFGGSIVLIVLAVLIIVSFSWSRQIILPLMRLDSTAKKISGGDIEVSVDQDLLDNKDEVGSLSRSFDVMIHSLRESMNSLKGMNTAIAKARDSAEDLVKVRTRELFEEHSRLLASINSLSFGFIIVDLDQKVILKNVAIMNLFGFKSDKEVTIQKISGLLGGFDIEGEAKKCLKGKGVCELKEILFDKKVLRGIVAPITSKSGSEEKIGYVLILEDITEAKVMERSRDEFFAVASHELRTPLTAIRGNTSMIMDSFGEKITDPDVKEMLSDINESAIRLIDIVNDFLEVSRLEQGRFDIKKEELDMPELVARVVRDLQTIVKQKNVKLELIEPSEKIPKALGDKGRVEQVLVNLVGNALKFTKDGLITVSLEISDQFVMVVVRDTGIGISEQNQARLFRKFQQAGESMLARDVARGTGLGLYISRLIVSSMGGTIGLLSSELGKGSTFAFTVPIIELSA